MTEKIKGYTNGDQFRKANNYDQTDIKRKLGLPVGDETPTVGTNIDILKKMESINNLGKEFGEKGVKAIILGLSSKEGPLDFEDLLKKLGTEAISMVALDITDSIFKDILKLRPDTLCVQADARNTPFEDNSFDIVLRDHLGNCCPPEIDRAINQEVARILKPEGVSIVNITTSDLLLNSPGRDRVFYDQLKSEVGDEAILALQNKIYDLEEFKKIFPEINSKTLRGTILEIEPEKSFVVFGEDQIGHGEWFRTLEDHKKIWERDCLEIAGIATRQGKDSHNPPLECLRHNVVLRKIISSK